MINTNPESPGTVVCVPSEQKIEYNKNQDSWIVDCDCVDGTEVTFVQHKHPNTKDQNSRNWIKNDFDDEHY